MLRSCTCTARQLVASTSARVAPSSSSRTLATAAASSSASPASSAPTPKPATALPESSCKAGTVIAGLNILKDGSDPVALEDSEYPAWLWTLVGKGKSSAARVPGDELKEALKQVRKEGKAAIKAANTLKG